MKAAQALLIALATFAVLLLPSLPAFWSPKKKQEMEEVKKQGVAIEKLAKDTQKSADTQKLDERIEAAHQVLHELMDTPDKGIPESVAASATCVAVVSSRIASSPRDNSTSVKPRNRRAVGEPGSCSMQ